MSDGHFSAEDVERIWGILAASDQSLITEKLVQEVCHRKLAKRYLAFWIPVPIQVIQTY